MCAVIEELCNLLEDLQLEMTVTHLVILKVILHNLIEMFYPIFILRQLYLVICDFFKRLCFINEQYYEFSVDLVGD